MRRAWLAVVLVAVLGADARAGGRDDLGTARTLKAQLDFEGALAACRHALGAGDLDSFDLQQIYQLAGEVTAGLDRHDEAFDWFRRLLALAPDTRLPEGTSPKIAAPFDRARDWLASNGELRVSSKEERTAFVVTVDNDPLHMVAGATVTLVDINGQATTQQRAETTEIRVPVPDKYTSVTVALTDEHGNLLRRLDSSRIDGFVAPGPGKKRPPIYARWKVWTVIAGVALATGIVEGIRVGTAQDEWDQLRAEDGQHDFSELAAIEDRGRGRALTANVSFGLAAVAGALAIVCAWREWSRDDAPAATPTVTLLGDGIGVGYAGHF
jgi:hypothetical protein